MFPATYQWSRFSDGPRLAVATLPGSECAALSIHIPAGSRDEDGFPSGLAHFVEHMVFKGTDRRTAKEISFAIEDVGGQLNACTSEDQTVYDARAEAGNLGILADVLCDMVWRARFPEEEIGLERDVIAEEITMYRETPSDHIGDLISCALWGIHPLGRPISGTHESIGKIQRAGLEEFSRLHHLRDDVVISAAGDFTMQQAMGMIAPHLPGNFRPAVGFLPFERMTMVPAEIKESRDSDQLQLALAWHTPGRKTGNRHALRILSTLLGESASSRLFLELREERGLCYQISSDVTLFDDTGAFEISAGLAHDSREEALDCICREIADLVAHGPRPDELERAKRIIIAQSKMAFESTAAHAAWAGESLQDFDRIPSPAEWRREILAVTAADVLEATYGIFSGQEPALAEIR